MVRKRISLLPTAKDLEHIAANVKAADVLRRKTFNAEHESFKEHAASVQNALGPFIDTVKPSEETLKKWQSQERARIKKLLAWKPPAEIPAIEPWHNPTFVPGRDAFAPFEEKFCFLATGCAFRGTDASIGRVGATTVCDAVGASSTASALTSVGVFFTADRMGTLDVSVTGRVFGAGHIGVFFSGYAEAVAGLRVYIERLSPTFEVYAGPQSNWYSHGNAGAEFNDIHVAGRPVGASHQAPADRGAVYRVWADCVQHSTQAFLSAAGVNYEVRIDSVHVHVI